MYGAERAAWAAALKPTDRVAIASGYRNDTFTITHVVGRTPSGLIDVANPWRGGERIRFRADGFSRGSERWSSQMLVPVTPKVEESVKRAAFANRCARTKWVELPLDTINAVDAALDAAEGK